MAPELPHLPDTTENRQPVVAWLVQQLPQILEQPHNLYELRLVFPYETESILYVLACDRDVPSPPSYLCGTVPPSCTIMLYEPPRWNMHVVQVTVG